jgi:carbon storage regulator
MGMLVLSRQKDEVVVIILPDGRVIEITVVDIRGDKVRLGTNAPKDIAVHRKEVYERIQCEKREAAKAEEDRKNREAHESPPPQEPSS